MFKRHYSSFFYTHVTREKLSKQRSYEKFAGKMLMKLTIGLPVTQAYQTLPYSNYLFSLSLSLKFKVQSNSVIMNSSGPEEFVRYNRSSL